VHVPGARAKADPAVRELPVWDHGADRREATLAVEPYGGLRGHPQTRLPGAAENRLALQFSKGEVVGHLTEDLGKRGVQGTADGGEQLGGGFLLSALDFRQVTEGNAGRGRNLTQRATLPQTQPT
jgi:hypothetical protein